MLRGRAGKVLSDPELKKRADNLTIPRLQYMSILPSVKPLDNIDCRKAIMYAVDQVGYQTAYGGEFAGGALASTLMPPSVEGHEKFDLYLNGADHKGDVNKAKEHLTACGQPNGFSTSMAYRADRPKEKARSRSSSRWRGRHQVEAARLPRPVTTSPSTPATRRTCGRTASAWPRTAGARTGTTASASCRRSSTAG